MRGDTATLTAARDALVRAAGPDAMIDAACVVGNFLRMTRIADGTAIPVDTPVAAISDDIRSELQLDRFRSAANSPRASALARTLGRLARPALTFFLARSARRGGDSSESN